MYEAAARAAQAASRIKPGRVMPEAPPKVVEPQKREDRESVSKAAKATGVSREYVRQAKALKAAAPEANSGGASFPGFVATLARWIGA